MPRAEPPAPCLCINPSCAAACEDRNYHPRGMSGAPGEFISRVCLPELLHLHSSTARPPLRPPVQASLSPARGFGVGLVSVHVPLSSQPPPRPAHALVRVHVCLRFLPSLLLFLSPSPTIIYHRVPHVHVMALTSHAPRDVDVPHIQIPIPIPRTTIHQHHLVHATTPSHTPPNPPGMLHVADDRQNMAIADKNESKSIKNF
mmetsp:Transcript_13747/g.40141  ORF Transcript_13747/g.40141 Transcript_13747/m.40141 type:complete len:202 (+) Transcript_13747:2479-3084(+)